MPWIRKSADRALNHCRAKVGKPVGMRIRPVELESARIPHFGSVDLANPVEPAKHLGFGRNGGRTTHPVPASRIGDNQAAIGIFQDVGGMKVGLIAHQKRGSLGPIGGAFFGENMAGDPVKVEFRAEQVARISEGVAARHTHAGGSGGAHLLEHGEQASGARVVLEDSVIDPPKNAAVNGVQDAVAFPASREVKKGATQEPGSGGGKRKPDRVVHPPGEDHLQLRAIGPGPKHVGRSRNQRAPIGQGERLLGKLPFAPVKESVGAGIGAMQIVSTPTHRL